MSKKIYSEEDVERLQSLYSRVCCDITCVIFTPEEISKLKAMRKNGDLEDITTGVHQCDIDIARQLIPKVSGLTNADIMILATYNRAEPGSDTRKRLEIYKDEILEENDVSGIDHLALFVLNNMPSSLDKSSYGETAVEQAIAYAKQCNKGGA